MNRTDKIEDHNESLAERVQSVDAMIQEQVREIVAHTLGLDLNDVEPTSSAQSLAAWTSLVHLQLMANLEQAFGVRLTMDDMMTMNSVSAIERGLTARGAAH